MADGKNCYGKSFVLSKSHKDSIKNKLRLSKKNDTGEDQTIVKEGFKPAGGILLRLTKKKEFPEIPPEIVS